MRADNTNDSLGAWIEALRIASETLTAGSPVVRGAHGIPIAHNAARAASSLEFILSNSDSGDVPSKSVPLFGVTGRILLSLRTSFPPSLDAILTGPCEHRNIRSGRQIAVHQCRTVRVSNTVWRVYGPQLMLPPKGNTMDTGKKLDFPSSRPSEDEKETKPTAEPSSRPLLIRGSFWAAIVAIATVGILVISLISYIQNKERTKRADRRKVDKLVDEALIKMTNNPDAVELGRNCDPPEGEDRIHLEEARILIDDAASLAPKYPRVLTARGIYHLVLCEDSPAERLFREAIREDDAYAPAQYDLGIVYYRRRRDDYAIEHFLRAAEIDPADARPLVNLGIVHGERKDYAEAIPPLKRASEIKPGDSDIWERLGIAYSNNKQWTEALLALRRAIELNENSYLSHYYIGITLRQAGNHREAVTHLMTARLLEPEEKGSYPALGDSLVRIGNPKDAQEVLTDCIERWPDFSDCHEGLEGLP